MSLFFYALVVALMIFIPVAVAMALRRRFAVPWALFCVGMATFVGSQLYHIPLNNWLTDIGVIGDAAAGADRLWLTAVVLGLSAGLSESIARAMGYGILLRRGAAGRRQDALMVGLGHGGIEAMLFGGVLLAASVSSLWSMQGTDLTTLGLSPSELDALQTQMDAVGGASWMAFAPLLERGMALVLHLALSVLVWLAVKKRNALYFVTAVCYHALVDGSLVYVAQQTENIWLIEGLLFLLLLPAVFWLWKTWPQTERPLTMPLREELTLFGVAIAHEWRFQWQSKRLLIVVAVFLVFGLISPLVAKFTPELLKSIEGAEQIADLIPEPTTADALGQYIKNITQFGFILAIVIGMGAVAGEKERGTAAIILSKPLPRWAFLLSKFIAQGAVFGLGFAAAGLGAYYYTLILFEPLALGGFLLGNLLLFLWLLTFTAVTLLASAIARSTAVAAGIAFGGAIVLLLAGAVPQWGALAPSGLVAWASELGLGAATPNGGAAAMGAVLIVVLLITAVAIFERQEL